MCGRYYIDEDDRNEQLRAIIEQVNRRAAAHSMAVKTAGEIFPGDAAPVLCRARSGERAAFPMRWGFSMGDARPLINARSETAAEKPMFRQSFAQRRCLMPMSAYFEWEKRGTARVKQRLSPAGGELCFLAGLYRFEDDAPVFCVLTRDAAPDIAFIHPRMPLILPAGAAEMWLDPAAAPAPLLALAETRLRHAEV